MPYCKPDADTIINKYLNYVYLFAFANLKNKSDAEDVTQDVLVQYITKSPDFESDEHAKHWLLKVTANLCKGFHKSAWKRYVSFFDDNYEQAYESNESIDNKVMIEQALKNLPPKYHTVIHLFYYEDIPINEISRILGISESAVKQRLKRGREKLKKFLGERGVSLED